jgi:hypothetical protein
MVKWEHELDLPTGTLGLNYDIFAKPKASDGWDARLYSTPVAENQTLRFSASPETVKKIYERLEAEFAEQIQEFEVKAAAYEEFATWARKNSRVKFGSDEWDRHGFLKRMGQLADTWEVNVVECGGREGVQIIIYDFDGDMIRDILPYGKPAHPEREYPPLPETK